MRIVKRIFLFIVILIAIALIAAIFVKKEYNVAREVSINKTADSVYNYIRYLRNQNDYSKWARMDPNMKKDFKGTDATPGFVSSWEGNDDVGKGEQTIKTIDDASRTVTYDLHFIKPFESHSDATMAVEPQGAASKVRWSFHGRMPYPMNLMSLFMSMDKMVGNDLQTGLDNLKQRMESQP
jgi:hypothetical protein